MARVTVEDCIEKIPNRFDLVLTAGQRARGILKGDQPTLDRDNDKNPVVALREIAAETVDLDVLQDGLVKKLQRLSVREEQEVPDDAAKFATKSKNSFDRRELACVAIAEGEGNEDVSVLTFSVDANWLS